jgi:hypothetical protein
MEDKPFLMTDFPKLGCPFVRKTFKVNEETWRRNGRRLQLREPIVYLVVDRVNPGYEWVLDDEDTFAVEKLNGSNVKIKTENGCLVAVQNRKNIIDPLDFFSGKTHIMEGIFTAVGKGVVKRDGEQFGELIGPKLQGNPYKLPVHDWYPFETAIERLKYRSFDEHDRTFDNWSSWFEKWLISRYFTKRAYKLGLDDQVMAEGVVFYNFKRRAENKTHMAKLRRDMFPWYYTPGVEIINYNKAGR